MNFGEINDLHKQLQNLSSFLKICPICDSTFKDILDKMILCKKCDREDKIKKILDENA